MARTASDMVRGREAEEQAAELAALLRLMDVSAGTFSLSMAVCNSPALRDYLIGRVQDVHPKLLVVRLPKGCVDVYGEVTACVNGASVGAIFVTGIEHSVSSELREYPALKSLNASRDLWEPRFPCPVVFWMPTYVAALIPLQAPDLWRYRSHGFEFVAPEWSPALSAGQELGGDFTLAGNLDRDQKRFRIAELEQRIAGVGSPPPSSLLPALVTWMSELGYLYSRAVELQKAEAVVRKALALSEAEGWLPGVAVQLGNLGSIATARGDLDSAEQHFEMALDANLSMGRLEGQATQLGNLGVVKKRRGDLAAAEQYFRAALERDRGAGRREGEAIHLGNLGAVLAERGALDAAEQCCRDALEIDEGMGRLEGRVNHLQNLGRIAEKRGDLVEARRLLSLALDALLDLGMESEAEDVRSKLATLPNA